MTWMALFRWSWANVGFIAACAALDATSRGAAWLGSALVVAVATEVVARRFPEKQRQKGERG